MTANQYRLLFVPLLATLILGGFVTTVGLITGPAALKYGVAITDIASQFTWFTGGVFLGGILAFFIFDYFFLSVDLFTCIALFFILQADSIVRLYMIGCSR